MLRKLILCFVAVAPALHAQTDGMSRELGEAILTELRHIRILLEKQQTQAATPAAPAPENVKVSSTGFSIGRSDAPLTLIEFADYQCPFCRQFNTAVYERLKTKYIDTGKVRFVSRDLPLDFHSNALNASVSSRCAGEQNKFWAMREQLISHADKLEAAQITGYAQSVGLDMSKFQSCVDSGKYVPAIRADIAEASSVGILGTPSFVLGKTAAAEFEGVKLVGAQPFEVFEKAILEQLAKITTAHTD